MVTKFKPTHLLNSGTLAELDHKFFYRRYEKEYGVFHVENGHAVLHPMDAAKEIPKTIKVSPYEEPEPLRVAPELGSMYWVIDHLSEDGVREITWEGDSIDHNLLAAGEVRASKEDAIAAHQARQKARGFERIV